MKQTRSHILFIILLGFISPVFASINQTSMLNASTTIQGLADTINTAKKNSDIPIIFPRLIAQQTANAATDQTKPQYFAYTPSAPSQDGVSYVIYVDAAADCHGAHYCNIGYIQAEKGGNPQIFYDLKNNEITKPVPLKNKIKAYFTPGHAMADYFPAEIQWRNKNILYTISWNTNRENIIKMANSAIESNN